LLYFSLSLSFPRFRSFSLCSVDLLSLSSCYFCRSFLPNSFGAHKKFLFALSAPSIVSNQGSTFGIPSLTGSALFLVSPISFSRLSLRAQKWRHPRPTQSRAQCDIAHIRRNTTSRPPASLLFVPYRFPALPWYIRPLVTGRRTRSPISSRKKATDKSKVASADRRSSFQPASLCSLVPHHHACAYRLISCFLSPSSSLTLSCTSSSNRPKSFALQHTFRADSLSFDQPRRFPNPFWLTKTLSIRDRAFITIFTVESRC
jgi:hypothetical protein